MEHESELKFVIVWTRGLIQSFGSERASRLTADEVGLFKPRQSKPVGAILQASVRLIGSVQLPVTLNSYKC